MKFNSISTDQIADLKTQWLKELTAPQDGMWEAFMGMSNQIGIFDEDDLVGYSCINEENTLIQFYLLPSYQTKVKDILETLIREKSVKNAMVGTNNPMFMSGAMDLQTSVSSHTLLYTEYSATSGDTLDLAQAGSSQLDAVVAFCHLSMGAPKEWLSGYIGNLIQRKELFLHQSGDEILGSCEVRISDCQPGIAELGMIVNPDQRRKGLGTKLLSTGAKMAIQKGFRPICSCEVDNIGSSKAIEASGFYSVHRLLLVKF